MARLEIDEDELNRLISGKKESWDRFVKTSASLVHAMVYRTMQHYQGHVYHEELEDAVQNVYEKLLQNEKALLKKYDISKASFSTWIGLISRSVTIDLLRKKRAHLPLNESITTKDTSSSAEEDIKEKIDLPKDLLTSRQELVLKLLFDKEMDPDEVAAFLGVEIQTIRSTKHKAIEKLRKYYKEKR